MGRLFPNYSSYIITSPFGMRTHPVTGKRTMHNGIDLVASNGSGGHVDYITAHTGGKVEAAGYSSSAGYYVNIRTDNNTVMVYYHMRETPYVKTGATVKAGDKLGYMGSTGTATGAHLHWGIKRNGTWIDPKPYLNSAYTGTTTNTNTATKMDSDESYSLTDFVKDVQKACGAAVDGIAGAETISKTVTLSAKKNARHAAVKAVQKRLIALGYTEVGNADGIAGVKFTSAVAHFQQDNGCVVDGEITARCTTWRKLLGMK